MPEKKSLLFLDNADNLFKHDAQGLGNLIATLLEIGEGNLLTILISSNISALSAFQNNQIIANVRP